MRSSSRCRSTAVAPTPSTRRSTTCASASARTRSPAVCSSAATSAHRYPCCRIEEVRRAPQLSRDRRRPTLELRLEALELLQPLLEGRVVHEDAGRGALDARGDDEERAH